MFSRLMLGRPEAFLTVWALALLSPPVLFVPRVTAVEPPVLEVVEVVGRRDLRALTAQSNTASIVDAETQVSLNRTVGDWIEQVPGVSLNGQGGLLQAYSVRGFSRWRVRTEVDGIPIITDRRAGNSASFVPPDLLSDVVVQKSASSALYGSGAMGGVVSLSTDSTRPFKMQFEGRDNDQLRAFTARTTLESGHQLGVSVRRADEAEAPDGRALNSGFEQAAAIFAGESSVGDYDVSYRWLPSVGRDIGKSGRFFPERRVSDYPEELHSLASIEIRRKTGGLLRAYHHYQEWEADVERVDERRNITEYRAHTVGGLFLSPTRILNGEGSWGAEWIGRRDVDITEREFDGSEIIVVDQSVLRGDEDNLGAFIDQRWWVGPVSLVGGLRFDHVAQAAEGRTERDGQLSGSLRGEYLGSQGWESYIEFASGYRFPSLSERYFNGTTPRGEIVGNPQLAPETRKSVEWGMRYQSDPSSLDVGVATFYSDLDDYIERFEVDADTIGYRNLSGARLYGFEVDAALTSGAFEHRLSYQWQRGDDETGRALADLNPATWRYFLRWVHDGTTVSSDLGFREERARFGEGELPLDSAWIWNLRLRQNWSARWSGELFLSNLLDEAYRATADDRSPLQPGRTVGVRFNWSRG